LRFFEASISVGARVVPRSGSTMSPASGWTALATLTASIGRGTSPQTACRKAATSGPTSGSSRNTPSRSTIGAAFTSALSAIPGRDAWPLRPWMVIRNGALIFSAVEQT
jgi:hypothetical protein